MNGISARRFCDFKVANVAAIREFGTHAMIRRPTVEKKAPPGPYPSFEGGISPEGIMGKQVDPVAQKLVDLCKEGKNIEAIESLYSKNAVSVEAVESPQMARKTEGVDKILQKNKWWMDHHEVHSQDVKGPFPHGEDKFAAIFDIDATAKDGPYAGKRFHMEEVAVYTVKDGRITAEEFYYPTA
jgi:hypothetical protein